MSKLACFDQFFGEISSIVGKRNDFESSLNVKLYSFIFEIESSKLGSWFDSFFSFSLQLTWPKMKLSDTSFFTGDKKDFYKEFRLFKTLIGDKIIGVVLL